MNVDLASHQLCPSLHYMSQCKCNIFLCKRLQFQQETSHDVRVRVRVWIFLFNNKKNHFQFNFTSCGHYHTLSHIHFVHQQLGLKYVPVYDIFYIYICLQASRFLCSKSAGTHIRVLRGQKSTCGGFGGFFIAAVLKKENSILEFDSVQMSDRKRM